MDGLASGGDNRFGPHEWVQILYDGRWHSIDPTFRLLKAPAHIQLADAGFFSTQDAQIDVVSIRRGVSHWWTIGAAVAVAGAVAVMLGIRFSHRRRGRATIAPVLLSDGAWQGFAS